MQDKKSIALVSESQDTTPTVTPTPTEPLSEPSTSTEATPETVLSTEATPEDSTPTEPLLEPSASTDAAPQNSTSSDPTPEPAAPPTKDTQSRKYLITINNPQDKGLDHEKIKEILSGMKSITYWCFSDEIGGQTKTYHTHLFIACKSPMRFSTVRNRFPDAHIDSAYGSSQDNRDYVRKEGRHAKEKGATSVPGTFEEWGTLPNDAKGGSNKIMESLYNMIVSGLSNYDILNQNPDYIPYLDKINQVRLVVNQEQSKSEWRDLETIYVFGETGLGKTRTIMQKHGYSNVFRVTDYLHPFDTYENQDIILFEEFSSSLRIQDMLNYLDGYPLKLPARYSDKHACYTKVYLTSNLDLDEQYQNIQRYEPSVWKAFLRRIHKVRKYINTNQYLEFTTEHYINGFHPADPQNTPFPSDSKSAADAESYKQELLELTGNNNTSKEPRKEI